MVAQREPIWLGYARRPIRVAHEGLAKTPAELICSVTTCGSTYSPGKYERHEFNSSGWYDTPELAARDAGDAPDHASFAYALHPLVWGPDGCSVTTGQDFLLQGRGVPQVLPRAGYELIGYDVIVASPVHGLGCSPLSCNVMADEHPVNRYCLIDTWDDAVAAAAAFGRDSPEPGPFVIVGVFMSSAVVSWPRELRPERLLLRRWGPEARAPFAALNAAPRVVERDPKAVGAQVGAASAAGAS